MSVHILSMVGQGFPDIIVGYRQRNYLFEIKDGKKSKHAQALTPQEEMFQRTWRGQLDTIRDVDEALKALGLQ